MTIPGRVGAPFLGTRPTSVLAADRTLLVLAGVHVNQHPGIAFEMIDQETFHGLGFRVGLFKLVVARKHEMKIDVDEIAAAPCPQLVNIDPMRLPMFFH